MNYKVIKREAFTVSGKSTTILCKESHVMIPEFWDECKKDGTIKKLHELGGTCAIMGIGENVYNNGSFK